MSVEKLSSRSKNLNQAFPFTQISNEVILNVKSPDAFMVYAYLLSKSREWKVIKEHIKNKYGFGATKMKQIFSYLHRCKLIGYRQRINKDTGKFEEMDILVLNGTDFIKDEPFLPEKLQKNEKSENLSTYPQTGGSIPVRTENRTYGNGGLLNKDIALKKDIQKSDLYDQKKPKRKSNEVSDEFLNAKKGNVKTAEYYLSNLEGIPKLARYKNEQKKSNRISPNEY
jgi:hypothetical protein